MKEHKLFIPYLSESFNDFIKRSKGSKTSKTGKKTFYNAQTDEKKRIKNHAKRIFIKINKIKKPIEIEWIPLISKYENHSKKKRAYDVLNYVHQYKYSEDQLQELKKIVNDNSKYVKRHLLNSPLDLPEIGKNGIMVIIRELDEKNIKELEDFKMSILEGVRDQIENNNDDDWTDLDFVRQYFEGN